MLTTFLLSLLLSGQPFSAMTPGGIEVINVSQRVYTPAAVDQAWNRATPDLTGYLMFESTANPFFGGFLAAAQSRTKVLIISPPECSPYSTYFQWAVLPAMDGISPKIGYVVVINSALSDDLVSFYPALQAAFAQESNLIQGKALPVQYSLCDGVGAAQ